MTTLLQIDFPTAGPFGQQMSEAYAALAVSISEEPGLVWKIWTESEADQTAGGIYLFTDEDSARSYLTMHSDRLEEFGIQGARAKILDVNDGLTAITRGPLS